MEVREGRGWGSGSEVSREEAVAVAEPSGCVCVFEEDPAPKLRTVC